MTLDHIGVIIFPGVVALRIVGRLAFPVFAYLIADGCFYTHDKRKYLGGIVALGLVCQIAYWFAEGTLEQSILTTLALGIIVVYALQLMQARRDAIGVLAVVGAVALAWVCCFAIGGVVGHGWLVDYGFWGVMLPALAYVPRLVDGPDVRVDLETMPLGERCLRIVPFAAGLVALALSLAANGFLVQWFSLATLVLLAAYNGKRGTWRLKYLFYIYYPAHLVVIWGIASLL